METIRKTIESYGYAEVQTPTFEFLKLFEIRSGEKFRDDVFVFQDPTKYLKDEDKVVDYVLRPEYTAPICRMYITSDLCIQPKPVKIYYIGSCYRYETPQPGRYREFTQVGVELIGSPHPEADVELIILAAEVLKALKLKKFIIRINDLNILRGLLSDFDHDYDAQNRIFNAIDGAAGALRKLDLNVPINKTREGVIEEVQTELKELGVAPELSKILESFLELHGDAKEVIPRIQALVKKAPTAVKAIDNSPLKFVVEKLKNYGLIDCEIDLGIARGLDYYTNIVFEIDLPILGNQKQVCGGGRYNRLIQEFGGEDTPATGFAFGFDRLLLAYSKVHERKKPSSPVDALICTYSPDEQDWALQVAGELRKEGFKVEIDLMRRKFKSSLSNANKREIPFAIIIGPTEKEQQELTLKDLESGIQDTMTYDDALNEMKEKLWGID